MTDVQIKCFLAVVKKKGITQAARSLYISQPAVSRHIAVMEKELGIPLFRHVGRNVVPTEFAMELHDLLLRYQEELQELVEKYCGQDLVKEKTVNIGYLFGWDFVHKASNVSAIFERTNKSMNLAFHPCDIKNALEGLKWGEYDAVLIIEDCLKLISEMEKYDVQRITEIDALLLYAKAHPAASLPSAPNMADFRDSYFYYYEDSVSGTIMREEIARYCKPYGYEPKLQQKASWHTCLAYAQRGLGVLVCDAWSAEAWSPQFMTTAFGHRHTIVLLWKKNNKNPGIPLLKESLLTFFSSEKDVNRL